MYSRRELLQQRPRLKLAAFGWSQVVRQAAEVGSSHSRPEIAAQSLLPSLQAVTGAWQHVQASTALTEMVNMGSPL